MATAHLHDIANQERKGYADILQHYRSDAGEFFHRRSLWSYVSSLRGSATKRQIPRESRQEGGLPSAIGANQPGDSAGRRCKRNIINDTFSIDIDGNISYF